MSSELIMYYNKLHNDCEDDLKLLTEIVLSNEKTITKPQEPQYTKLRSYKIAIATIL